MIVEGGSQGLIGKACLSDYPMAIGIGGHVIPLLKSQWLPLQVRAYVHSARLSAPTWKNAIRRCNTTFAFTGDLGTECRFNLYKCDMRRVFGQWIEDDDNQLEQGGYPECEPCRQPRALADADEDEFDVEDEAEPAPALPAPPVHAPDPPPADDDFELEDEGAAPVENHIQSEMPLPTNEYEVNLRQSVYVAEMMHIIDNITEGLKTGMAWYGTFIMYLTHICRLLRRPWSNKRFRYTCFNTAALEPFSHMFEHFTAGVFDGRWKAVINAIAALIQLEHPLRAAWGANKYTVDGDPGYRC